MNSQIIGGMFGLTGLSDIRRRTPFFLKDNDLLTVNARSSIKMLVAFLKPGRVWVPSFLCEVMLSAVRDIEVRFYEVNENLQVSCDDLNQVQSGDLVIFIDYFGFPFDPSLARRVKERGGWVLEDASQALLSSHVGENSDFIVFSPRKFLGVPDGGILRNNTSLDLFGISKLNKPPSVWWLKAFSATLQRDEFDRNGGERKWFDLFKEVDHDGPIGFFAMSDLSAALLKYNFDYSLIIQKRTENYKILNSYLNDFALFPEIAANVVPLGYPIRLNNRDSIRKRLFENDIYPPIHWTINTIVPKTFIESHHLADTIMTLVCDQRYNASDMEKTAKIILQKAKNGETNKKFSKK